MLLQVSLSDMRRLGSGPTWLKMIELVTNCLQLHRNDDLIWSTKLYPLPLKHEIQDRPFLEAKLIPKTPVIEPSSSNDHLKVALTPGRTDLNSHVNPS